MSMAKGNRVRVSIVGTPGAKLETGAKTEHGRPDQNRNRKKVVRKKGARRDDARRCENGRTGHNTHGPSGNRKTLDSRGRKLGLGATHSII